MRYDCKLWMVGLQCSLIDDNFLFHTNKVKRRTNILELVKLIFWVQWFNDANSTQGVMKLERLKNTLQRIKVKQVYVYVWFCTPKCYKINILKSYLLAWSVGFMYFPLLVVFIDLRPIMQLYLLEFGLKQLISTKYIPI